MGSGWASIDRIDVYFMHNDKAAEIPRLSRTITKDAQKHRSINKNKKKKISDQGIEPRSLAPQGLLTNA